MESSSAEHSFTSKRGIVFELIPVSRYLIIDLNNSIPVPKPPVVFIESKGEPEENPNDPDYIEALRTANYKKGNTVSAAYLAMGTKVISIPEGIESVESTDWSDMLESCGVNIPIKGRARYVAWLKYYALPDDFEQLLTAAMREGSVTIEEDVKKTENSFRSDETRDTAEGVST